MTPGPAKELLELLRRPSDLDLLRQRVSIPLGALKGLLAQLEARGLVSTTSPGNGACRSGCGACSFESFCPSSAPRQEPAPLLPNALVWRLTPLGEAQLVSG